MEAGCFLPSSRIPLQIVPVKMIDMLLQECVSHLQCLIIRHIPTDTTCSISFR